MSYGGVVVRAGAVVAAVRVVLLAVAELALGALDFGKEPCGFLKDLGGMVKDELDHLLLQVGLLDLLQVAELLRAQAALADDAGGRAHGQVLHAHAVLLRVAADGLQALEQLLQNQPIR